MDPYTTRTYLGMLAGIKRPKRFLLELFFPREQVFLTKEVVFEKVKATRRLAPFVSPTVAGKPQPGRGFVQATFSPPYLKPKNAIDPTMTLKRRAGESLSGDLQPIERREAIRLELLEDQDDQITRREEWMAAQLLLAGVMLVVAEDHPPMAVNLQRNPLNTIVLTGTLRWGEPGVSAFKFLQGLAPQIATRSGFAPRTVVLDPLAAGLLLQDDLLVKLATAPTPPTGLALQILGNLADDQDEAVYLGTAGGFQFWQYQSQYTDSDGTVRNMMPDYTVIMGSPSGGEGIRLYGAILDDEVLEALPRFPKEWVQNDPSVRYLMTQSAPLPVIPNADATVAITVR